MQFGNVKSALRRAKARSAPARPIGRSGFRPNAASAFRSREPLSLKSVLLPKQRESDAQRLRRSRNSEKPQKSAIF
jgi:hypothetical protein